MHLFVDNLTNVDFSYLHPQRGLVGETWLASIVLEGALDQQGMVCDFGIVKKTLRQWLDSYIDHRLVVPRDSSQLDYQVEGDQCSLTWGYSTQALAIHCSSPSQAITLIDSDTISPDTVAKWCIEQLRHLLPDTIDRIQLTFKPEVIEHHFYHYSHGLKKHEGNCQRIAHGHRSTIEIYSNNQRSHHWEAYWSKKWDDIYIGSRDDLIEEIQIEGIPYYQFQYLAQQGHFELTLPVRCCYLIDTDSTVEFIAQHIASCLKTEDPENAYQVRAFEGIGKGAIAYT